MIKTTMTQISLLGNGNRETKNCLSKRYIKSRINIDQKEQNELNNFNYEFGGT